MHRDPVRAAEDGQQSGCHRVRLKRTSSLAHGGYMVNIYTQSDHACNSLDDDSQRKVRLETSLMPFYLGAPGEPGAIQDMVAR